MLTAAQVKTGLATATGFPAALYAWKNQTASDYLVVTDEPASALWADGKRSEEMSAGTVDLFTKTADGSTKAAVEVAFNGMDLSYYLNSVQYEDDTGYIHYEWVWEAV